MIERFRVVGGTSLRGEVPVVGAKNSALKLMAVALLAVGRTRLSNVPAIVDVTIMAELLRRLGCTVDYDADAGVVEIDVPEQIGHRADYDLVRALRASISVLGPLVARCGQADVAVPGGDAIGSRGLDLHAAGWRRSARRCTSPTATSSPRRRTGCAEATSGWTSRAWARPRTSSAPRSSPPVAPGCPTRRASPRSSTSPTC